jgi:hypothetical protein
VDVVTPGPTTPSARRPQVGDDRTAARHAAVKLLQGYVWHPRDLDVDLREYLPSRLEPDVNVLLGRHAGGAVHVLRRRHAVGHAARLPVHGGALRRPDEDPAALLPWLAETLQAALERTPEGVGWQVMEDLRDLG